MGLMMACLRKFEILALIGWCGILHADRDIYLPLYQPCEHSASSIIESTVERPVVYITVTIVVATTCILSGSGLLIWGAISTGDSAEEKNSNILVATGSVFVFFGFSVVAGIIIYKINKCKL